MTHSFLSDVYHLLCFNNLIPVNILLMYVLGSLVGLILVSALMITLYCYRKKNKMRNIQNVSHFFLIYLSWSTYVSMYRVTY